MKKLVILVLMSVLFVNAAYSFTDADLENDLKFYERTASKNNLNDNDRLFILLKIKNKYAQSEVDAAWLDSEIERLKRSRDISASAQKSDPENEPAEKPSAAVGEITVSDIKIEKFDGYINITAFVNNPGKIKHFLLSDTKARYNPKIVVDIDKAVENVEFKKKDFKPEYPEIKRVRIGQFMEKPEAVSRIIIELDKTRKYTAEKVKGSVVVSIEVEKPAVKEAAAPPPKPLKNSEVKPKPAEPKPVSPADIDSAYKIAPGDIVSVAVSPVNDLSKEAEVDDNGFIDLKLINKVMIKDLQPKQASALIKEKMGRYIKNADVDVKLVKFGAKKVFVIGQVNLPVENAYGGSANIYDYIRANGGFKATADLSSVLLYRGKPGKRSQIIINVAELLRLGQENEIPILEPGDIIEVAGIKTAVSIIGEVEKPGKYELAGAKDISLFKLLAKADGHTKAAYLKKIIILREDKTGAYRKIFFNMEKALKSKTKTDIILNAGDIVYIPLKN